MFRTIRPSARRRPSERTILSLELLEDRAVLSPLLQPVSPLNAALPASDSAGGVSQIKNSADGRFIVYSSAASNLVVNQINEAVASNVFVYDQATRITTLVSHRFDFPTETGNAPSGFARISGDGSFIVFSSGATDLVPAQTGPLTAGNVYLFDNRSGQPSFGQITLVSHRSDSPTISANDFSSTQPTTGFGFNFTNNRYLIYDSYASDIVTAPGQFGPTHSNVYRYDTATGQNLLISREFGFTAAGGDDDSLAADISEDGNSIAFASLAQHLVFNQIPDSYPTTVNGAPFTRPASANNAFLWSNDSNGATVFLLSGAFDPSLSPSGTTSPNRAAGLGTFAAPAISPDGGFIAFISDAPDLVPNQRASTDAQGNPLFTPNVFGYNRYFAPGTQSVFLHSGAIGTNAQGQPAPSTTVTSDGQATQVIVSRLDLQNTGIFTIAYIDNATNLYPNQGSTAFGNVFLDHPYSGILTLASSVAFSNPLRAAGGVYLSSDSDFTDLSISDNGRFVTYQSFAANIIPGQQSDGATVNTFVYDQASNTNALLSHPPGSFTRSGDRASPAARVSANGQSIALLSFADDLVTGLRIASGGPDLYLYNSFTTAPVLASVAATPAVPTSLVWGTDAVGRFAVLTTNAPSVTTGLGTTQDTNGDQDVFLRDLRTGTLTLVSHAVGNALLAGDNGSPHTTGGVVSSGAPVAISADGSSVVFVSRDSNLIPGQAPFPGTDPSFVDNIFLYDRSTGQVRLVSHVALLPPGAPGSPRNTAGDVSSFNPVISSDGRYIAYTSYSKSLVAGMTGFQNDLFRANVFLYDTVTDTTTVLSGTPASGNRVLTGNGDSVHPVISDDGHHVVFQSRATNLIPADDVFASNNVYVFDFTQTPSDGRLTLVSHIAGDLRTSPSPAQPSNASAPGSSVASFKPVISSDGSTIAFVSFAANLVPGQTGIFDTTEVFLYDRQTGQLTLASGANGSASATANNYSDSPAINDDGAFVAFRSSATNLVAGQSNQSASNIFLFSRSSGLTLVSHDHQNARTTANNLSSLPFLNGDGSLVTYLSTASDLVPGQTGGVNNSGGGINNVFGWVRTSGLNFLASGQGDSPTQTASFPIFLPIISRDPVIFFNASGDLLTGGAPTSNAYANTLINVSFTPTTQGLTAGNPPGTPAGTLSAVSVLAGQVALATFTLPAGAALDNGLFAPGAVRLDSTAPLQFVNNVTGQTTYSIGVQASAGGLVSELTRFPFALTINPPPATVTTITSALPNPAEPGQEVTFLATVSSGGGTPNGSVQLLDRGGVPLGGVGPVFLVNGVATLRLTNLGIGTHFVTAVYAGATGFQGSTSPPITETINPPVVEVAGTFTTITAALPNPTDAGQVVTFQATVRSGGGIPDGLVQLLDGGNFPLGNSGPVPLVNGVATLQLSNLGVGAHTVTAVYAGATGFQGSTSPPITETVNAGPLRAAPRQTIGMFDNSGFNPNGIAWYLRSDNSPGFPDAGPGFVYGLVHWHGVVGDWNGDGLDTVGVVDPTNPAGAVWYLRNSNSSGPADYAPFVYGLNTWTPLVGDWTGRGHSGIGMFDPTTGNLYLRYDPATGPADSAFQVGLPGFLPIAGDFFGLGHSGVGVVDPATMTWYLKEVTASGDLAFVQLQFGVPGWKPVVGDWDGDGVVTVGVVDPLGNWYLRNTNSAGAPDVGPIPYGLPFWTPVSGRYPPPVQALRAAGQAPGTDGGSALDDGSLQTIVTAALERLSSSGVGAPVLARLAAVQYQVGMVPDGELGQALVNEDRVVVRPDASGQDWFIDPTPLSDEEFTPGGPGSPLVALPGSSAAGREDLLTVVLHEMGHLAGLPDRDDTGDGSDLMAGVLAVSTRRTQALDMVFAGGL